MSYYGTVGGADTYNTERGRGTEWDTFSNEQKEAALTRATDYIDQMYRYQLGSGEWVARWSGERTDPTTPQEREWPRVGAQRYNKYPVPDNTTPQDVEYATYEAAFYEAQTPGYLTPPFIPAGTKGGVIQETVGPITIKYDGVTGQTEGFDKRPPNMPILFSVERLVAPYLRPVASFYDIGVRVV